MPKTTRVSIDTPEEVLVHDIESLERPRLRSWGIWTASVVFAAILGGLGTLALVVWDRTALPIVLTEPLITLDQPPRVFRWNPVRGAVSYIVAVAEIGSGDVVLLRPARDVLIAPSDVEGANLVPGRYTWSVEALGRDGTTLAEGKATFEIREPGAR